MPHVAEFQHLKKATKYTKFEIVNGLSNLLSLSMMYEKLQAWQYA